MDGILNLDKPAGMTSHDVVTKVRRLLNTRKVGHAGTLDPDAVGVLVVAVGQATRLLSHLPTEPKVYVARIAFGVATDTEDASGNTVEEADASALREADLFAVLPRFVGEIQQIPPMVSAVHHEGKRLYELARQGITVERQPRAVTVHSIDLLSPPVCPPPPTPPPAGGGEGSGVGGIQEGFAPGKIAEATLRVSCGGGTYIRTLCVDIGGAVGLPAHMKSLVREAVGPFRREVALTLEALAERGAQALLPLERTLGFPEVALSDADAERIRHGMSVRAPDKPTENTVSLLHRERLVALAHYTDGEFKPFKVFV